MSQKNAPKPKASHPWKKHPSVKPKKQPAKKGQTP